MTRPCDDEEPMMTWIPTGTQFARTGPMVSLMFPTDDDAILFLEVILAMGRCVPDGEGA